MRVGVPTELAPSEHRVALTPDAVTRLIAGRLRDAGRVRRRDRCVAAGRGLPRGGRNHWARPATCWPAPTSSSTSARSGSDEVSRLRPGQVVVGYIWPLIDAELVESLAAAGVTAFGMESVPRGHTRPADGCALLTGDGVGLQGGHHRRRAAAAVLPDADDRRRHGRPGQGAGAGRRRRGPSGDRDRPSARRRGVGVRHPPGRQGAGREPGREVRGAGRRGRRRPGRARLRDRAHARAAGAPAGAAGGVHRRLRRRDHHRARARAPGAAADPGLGGRGDAGRIGDRRPGRRDRRQLRADRAGRGRQRSTT